MARASHNDAKQWWADEENALADIYELETGHRLPKQITVQGEDGTRYLLTTHFSLERIESGADQHIKEARPGPRASR